MIRLRPAHWALALLLAAGIHLLLLAGLPSRPTALETGQGTQAISIDLGHARPHATTATPDPQPVAQATSTPQSARNTTDGGEPPAAAPAPAARADSPTEPGIESEVPTEVEAESAIRSGPDPETAEASHAQPLRTESSTASAGERQPREAAGRQSARYLAELRRWLANHRRYPRRAQMRRLEGIAQLEIELNADGQPRASRIVESSGHRLLDQAVRQMILRAQPFPSPPAELDVAGRVITVPVEFSLR